MDQQTMFTGRKQMLRAAALLTALVSMLIFLPAGMRVQASEAAQDQTQAQTEQSAQTEKSAQADDNTVRIRLKPVEGTLDARSLTVRKKGRIGELPKPHRKGYRFEGWYTGKNGGTEVTAATKVSSLKRNTLYAHWRVRYYRITYDYNGGQLKSGRKNPRNYNVEQKVTLYKPSRKGYLFKGWYTTPDYKKGTRVSALKGDRTGRLTLYAKFDPITYKIRFKSNGVITQVPKTMTCYYGKRYKLPGSTDKGFDHWNTSKTESGKSYAAGKSVKNLAYKNGAVVTLYASIFTGDNNIEKLVKYLVRVGFTKEAAAGIAGNLMWESGGGPFDIKLNAVELSTGRGVGMVQWTDTPGSPRRTNFVNFCSARGEPWPNSNLKVQIDFLLEELKGTYGSCWGFSSSMGYPSSYSMTLDQFKACTNVTMATRAFCACFERPYAVNAHLDTRVQYAKIALQYFKKK